MVTFVNNYAMFHTKYANYISMKTQHTAFYLIGFCHSKYLHQKQFDKYSSNALVENPIPRSNIDVLISAVNHGLAVRKRNDFVVSISYHLTHIHFS